MTQVAESVAEIIKLTRTGQLTDQVAVARATPAQLDAYMRYLEHQFSMGWPVRARIAIRVRDERLYERLGHHSFGAWLENACPRSKSHIYAAIKAIGSLTGDLGDADLAQIPIDTAEVLALLPAAKRTKEMVTAAKTKKRAAFIKHVREVHPEEAIPDESKRRFKWTTDEEVTVDKALADVKARHAEVNGETLSDSAAFVALCADHELASAAAAAAPDLPTLVKVAVALQHMAVWIEERDDISFDSLQEILDDGGVKTWLESMKKYLP